MEDNVLKVRSLSFCSSTFSHGNLRDVILYVRVCVCVLHMHTHTCTLPLTHNRTLHTPFSVSCASVTVAS